MIKESEIKNALKSMKGGMRHLLKYDEVFER
jgi:hypothetical protein